MAIDWRAFGKVAKEGREMAGGIGKAIAEGRDKQAKQQQLELLGGKVGGLGGDFIRAGEVGIGSNIYMTDKARDERRKDEEAARKREVQAKEQEEMDTLSATKDVVEAKAPALEPFLEDAKFKNQKEYGRFKASYDAFVSSGDVKDFDAARKAIEDYEDRTTKASEISQRETSKRKAGAEKREKEQQDIIAGIDLMLALAEGVEPSGRIIGTAKNLLAKAGLDPQTATLNNVSGLLAGQIAKKIGGESGRLTDQDRIYALNVTMKGTDTDDERRIKRAVFEAFRNPDVESSELRKILYAAVGDLYGKDPKKYQDAAPMLFNEKGDKVGSGAGGETEKKTSSFDDAWNKY